jgi:preprotein translocase subunit SecD
MHRRVTFMICAAITIFTGVLQAQGQFTIHAASAEPVAGWQKMDAEDKSVWVNPTPALTSADLERAIPERGPEGRNTVTTVFTEAGAKKMREFTATQIDKLIAMVLDGKVIFAPRVRGVLPGPERTAVITGNGPTGLTIEQVQKILVSINRSQK